MHTGKGSRSYGTVLIDKGNPVARGSSKAITRKFDVSHYELTGEIRYLDDVESEESVISFNYCRKKQKHCKDVKGCEFIPDGKCGHMSIGQEGVPTPSKLAPVKPERVPEGNPISEVESEPRRTTEAIALELIAKVREQEVSVMLAKIGDYFGQANQAMDDLLKTESKIDRLMYEIQADLLKVVEKE